MLSRQEESAINEKATVLILLGLQMFVYMVDVHGHLWDFL